MTYSKLAVRVAVGLGVCAAATLIYRGLNQYDLNEVTDALVSIPAARLAAAGGFAAASYLCLTGFDYLGIRYAGKRLAWRRAALASFTSLSIGHNIGVAALSSGAIRYRFYSRWGLSAEDLARIILFSGITVCLGLSTLGGLGLLLYPSDAEDLLGMSPAASRAIALACLIAPAVYLAAATFLRGEIKIWRWKLHLPHPKLAFAQTVLGTVNYAFVAACLHQLLSALETVPYLKAAAIYAIANGTALVSHVPGGLGVLEATAVYLLPGAASVAALVGFRIVYFFVPLAIGLTVFLSSEILLRGQREDADPEVSANPAE